MWSTREGSPENERCPGDYRCADAVEMRGEAPIGTLLVPNNNTVTHVPHESASHSEGP